MEEQAELPAARLFCGARGGSSSGGSSSALFTDAGFPPALISIDGRSSSAVSQEAGAPRCRCTPPLPAKLCTVSKDGPSQGRFFWGCSRNASDRAADATLGRCNFFQWAPASSCPHSSRDLALRWARLRPEHGYVVVGAHGFRADDVRQGSVGDCWFLAALAVVASRPDLISRLILTQSATPYGGPYRVQLFIDGEWRVAMLDDAFPVHPVKQKAQPKRRAIAPPPPPVELIMEPGEDGGAQRAPGAERLAERLEPAFSKATGQQLWPSLVEKAYARAHGCYHAISGGWV